MADDVILNPAAGGDTIAADDIGGIKHQRVKVQYGDDGSATDASATNPLPVILGSNSGVDAGDFTVNNGGGASAVPIQDGGNSITVDGTVTADAGTGPWPVTDNGGALTVDDGGLTLSVDDGGGSLTIDGTVGISGAVPVTDNGGNLSIDDGGNSITIDVDGSAWPTEQPTESGDATDPTAPVVIVYPQIRDWVGNKWYPVRGGVTSSTYGAVSALVFGSNGSIYSANNINVLDDLVDLTTLGQALSTFTNPILVNDETGTDVTARQRNNERDTALSSSARTATTTSGDLENYNERGATLMLDVTAGSGFNLTVQIQMKGSATSNYFTIASFGTAITATGQYVFQCYPGANDLLATSNLQVQSLALPRIWRVQVTHADSTSVTYSMDVHYTV